MTDKLRLAKYITFDTVDKINYYDKDGLRSVSYLKKKHLNRVTCQHFQVLVSTFTCQLSILLLPCFPEWVYLQGSLKCYILVCT